VASVEDAKKRILARVSLEQLIGDRIKPQRRSGRVVGLCPFHSEKSPSFYIFDDHYHCFGCGAHGDAISYVQHEQGLGFIDALKWLGNKFGVDAPELERSSENFKERGEKTAQARMMAAAQNFFVSQLFAPPGEAARQYLINRGFTEEQIKELGFGFAPPGRYQLVQHLGRLGISISEMVQGSLANHYDGQATDFFRNRVMVPIRDLHGRLIAFGGRTLGDDPQKYKNSRYDKGTVLFGLDRARKLMREKSRGIVVEGYLDCLQLWQAGFPEAVACQGTALTSSHMRLLRFASGVIYLLFDGDQAGRAASLKVLTEALEFPDIQFKVSLLPDGEDPDSFVRKFGPEALETLFRQSIDLIDYGISQRLLGVHESAIPDLVSKELIPWLSQLTDPVKKSYLVHKTAQATGIDTVTLMGQLQNPNGPHTKLVPLGEQPHIILEPINSDYREFLAHLFFASVDELDLEKISEFLLKKSELNGKWLDLAQECLKSLAAAKTPYSQDTSLWDIAGDDEVSEFIDKIKQVPDLYKTKNRMDSLRQIWVSLQQKDIKGKITKLKSKVATLNLAHPESQEQWKQLAQAVTLLNKELDKINKSGYDHGL
jgi:DNA primase